MKQTGELEYYIKNKAEFMKDFNKFLKLGKTVLKKHFSDSQIEQILATSKLQYESLIYKLPYIGGHKNSGTKKLIMSAWVLAIVRSLEGEGAETEKIGRIIYELFDIYIKSTPGSMNKIVGKIMLSRFGMKILKEKYKQNSYSHFPCGWANEYVECDGSEHDFGLDVTKCGICTFYKNQGAEKFTRYLCLGDYLVFKAQGIGFSRTQTLGNGGTKCDFRFKKGGCSPSGWPPEALREWSRE